MIQPRLSFIITAYNRPQMLLCALASLQCQTRRDFEIIVVDNAADNEMSQANQRACEATITKDIPVSYNRTLGPTCYHSTEYGVKLAQGDYVCFPSDDSYYVPKFVEKMMAAIESVDLDLFTFDMIYENNQSHQYEHMIVSPQLYHIDKTGFILRKSKFMPFPRKPEKDEPAPCDGLLVNLLMSSGVRHGKINEILAVHN